MAENSKIEWCDHTFNPWIGCQKVSAARSPNAKLQPAQLPDWPRLMSREIAAAYLCVSPNSFGTMVANGTMPKATHQLNPKVTRWDRRQIDEAIDRLAGGVGPSNPWDKALGIGDVAE